MHTLDFNAGDLVYCVLLGTVCGLFDSLVLRLVCISECWSLGMWLLFESVSVTTI